MVADTFFKDGELGMLTGRTGLIIWLNHVKYAKALKKFGIVHYVSKKMGYAVLYCDSDQAQYVINRLEKQKFIKKVELSYLNELKTDYAGSNKELKKTEELIF
jgi:uncharacterized protein YlbG (UPF0298 family)